MGSSSLWQIPAGFIWGIMFPWFFVLVALGGFLVTLWLLSLSRRPQQDGTGETPTSSERQEATVRVGGGASPQDLVIVVQHGKPVRLNFRREDTTHQAEKVVFGDFGKSAELPEGVTVPIEFVPENPGEYEFACESEVLHGKLVVR